MLLSFMYHRVNLGHHSNRYDVLKDHLQYLKDHCHVVVSGEELHPKKTNVCMVFDDATVDFYHYIFPLLREHSFKAMLAVPVSVIPDDDRGKNISERVSASSEELLYGAKGAATNPFCTWNELRSMERSGFVQFASHSLTHVNLRTTSNYQKEIVESKKALEERLDREIDAFVYPYADFNRTVSKEVQNHYRYQFSAGAGDNRDWNGVDGILFRVNADRMLAGDELLRVRKLLYYRFARLKLHAKKIFMDRQPFSYPISQA